MEIKVHTKEKDYSILLERGALYQVKDYVDAKRRVFIVTDSLVPKEYLNVLQEQFPQAKSYVFESGEKNKNLSTYAEILKHMLEAQLDRKDVVIALGGGVVGDLSGFAAATYMRGIDYINIPTTVLSQIDSSIGGKTAVDFEGVKNSVGAFHQPAFVIIDPDTLKTLPKRQIRNGLAEAVKMGMTGDEKLFEIFEKEDYMDHMEEIIERSLRYKKRIVEEDEKETGIRRVLNFGHTYGHAYESVMEGRYLHGECVGMGMMRVVKAPDVKERLQNVLQRLELPLSCDADQEEVYKRIVNDKKSVGDAVNIIQVNKIGEAVTDLWKKEEIKEALGV
ncbi:MAG: 3-dehydroquinate synthase [Erysipelotrichaceae bacterium]|nr:3-dehydroquinate synthase [Erysipelotrichaceae bacterium]